MTDNVDTPQETGAEQAFEGPWSEGDSNTSVEDAFFGSQEMEAAEEVPQVDTPQSQPVQEQAEEYNAKNDEKRFEYWQSQAAKAQNQLAQQQQQMEAIQQQQFQMQQPQQPVQEEPVEQFPAPPERPKKPRTFNREEAYSDPNSESARYLEEHEEWRDSMTEYNGLKQEYQLAQVQEKFEQQEKARQDEIRRNEAYQAQQQQVQGVHNHLTGHYGFNDSDAKEFIDTMSDPNSLSLDNLVSLYRIQKGSPQSDNTGPSPEFQQAQRAQQIPSPMGVQPSQGAGNDQRSPEASIMDNMIADFNKKNPW